MTNREAEFEASGFAQVLSPATRGYHRGVVKTRILLVEDAASISEPLEDNDNSGPGSENSGPGSENSGDDDD
jgi:hypothetical protein